MIGCSYSPEVPLVERCAVFLTDEFRPEFLRDHCKTAKAATTYTAGDFKLCTAIVLEFNRRFEPPITLKLAAS
jgi:hypothetical protein